MYPIISKPKRGLYPTLSTTVSREKESNMKGRRVGVRIEVGRNQPLLTISDLLWDLKETLNTLLKGRGGISFTITSLEGEPEPLGFRITSVTSIPGSWLVNWKVRKIVTSFLENLGLKILN